MGNYKIITLQECPQLLGQAASWFHSKWGIPQEAYQESMRQSLKNEGFVPEWYLAIMGGKIIGGMGVIENDFHKRKDLAPNVCAVYVEEECRGQGIAGRLLEYVCDDMGKKGISTLYLATDHTSFYERYGWEFLCMAQEEDGEGQSRMYMHRQG